MRISIPEATGILNQVMRKLGHAEEDLHPIVDHLMDCELRGLSYGGMARAVAITERIGRLGMPKEPITKPPFRPRCTARIISAISSANAPRTSR